MLTLQIKNPGNIGMMSCHGEQGLRSECSCSKVRCAPSSDGYLVEMENGLCDWRSGNNQSVGSSSPVVSRCFPGGYNVKLYISRGRLAWWLLAFLHSVWQRAINLLATQYLKHSAFQFHTCMVLSFNPCCQ